MSPRLVWTRRSVMCAGCSAVAMGCTRPSLPRKAAVASPGKPGGTSALPSPAGSEDTAAASDSADTGAGRPDCTEEVGTEEDGWVAISLDDYPELREPGGHVWLSDPDNLLYIMLVCTEPDCWAAVWSTCTHGACIVEWDDEAKQVWCACHGSRFGTDGTVQQGPATEDLTAFEVGERDGMLWVKRW